MKRARSAFSLGVWYPVLGGSWVVFCRVIRNLSGVISIVSILVALLTTTYQPPSRSVSRNINPSRR